MELKHVLTPLLFKATNDAVEIQLKYTNWFLNLITYQTLFQQIFYNFKPFAQIKNNIH